MTPFRNDESNPFNRQSVWPSMPQTALRVGPWPKAERPPAPGLEIDEVMVAAAEAEPEVAVAEPVAPEPAPAPALPLEAPPMAPPIGVRRVRAPRQGLRLTPLVAAAAVGAGGMAALFLLIGVGEPRKPPSPPVEARSTLEVGDLVGASAPPPAAATPGPAPAAALRAAPELAVASPLAPRQMRGVGATPPAKPVVHLPAVAAAPFSTQLLLPPPQPAASLAGPAETPLTPPPSPPAAFVPPAAPDRDAPIPTHVPDAA